MIMKTILRNSFGHVKPLKIHGQTEGNGVHFVSNITPNNIQIESPLETLIASLAACELATLKAVSRNSKLKIGNVKFTRVQSGLDVEKFMKGGPQDKIEDIAIDAEIQTNVTQQELNQWMQKAYNSCPVYQMFKLAGVKVESNWKNVKTIA